MHTHPLVLAAWIVTLIGAILFMLGRRGRLVSRAEFCRKCGHETTSAGPRCTECGAPLTVSSMRLAFELNHPLLARLGAVTRRGRRTPNTPLIAWGLLALMLGLGVGAGIPAMRLAKIDWNRFRDSNALIASAEKLRFDDPRHARIMGVLEARQTQGRLTPPQLAAVQRINGAVRRYESDMALAQMRAAMQQPIYSAYVPPVTPRTPAPAPSSGSKDVGPSIASIIGSIEAQLDVQPREVVTYEPPPIATGYNEPVATAINQGTLSPAPGLSQHFGVLAGLSLPAPQAHAASQTTFPRFSPATGLAPRGALSPRFGTSFGSLPATSSMPASITPMTSSLTPGMIRPTTFNNPALSPTTLPNRPLTPSRISNAFGR